MNNKMICLLLSLVLTACGSNQETVPATKSINYTPIFVNFTSSVVENAAQVGLPILTGVVGSDWAGYGFLNQSELASAQVGTPYHVFGMSNAGKEGQVIFDVGYWLFPVMVNNEYRCMLTVDKYNGEWTAVGIGAAGLATWLQAMEKSHPLLDFKAKGLVKLYDHDSTILMLNPSEQQPLFLLLPYLTDLLKYLPQYSDWVNNDPVPVLSFQEIFSIYSHAH